MKSTSPTTARIKSFGRWANRYCFLIALLFLVAVYTVEYIEAGLLPANAAYTIANSARFISGNSDSLTRTPGSVGNRRTWTFSAWVKLAGLNAVSGLFEGYSTSNDMTSIYYDSSAHQILLQEWINGTTNSLWYANGVLRDPAAWYHLVVVFDTTQASPANMVKMYINGVAGTTYTLVGYSAIAQNFQGEVNNTVAQHIGLYQNGSPLDGYMADVYFVDGQALDPTSFAATDSNGYWRAKAYTGTYGTNGFHLNFSNGASLGTDTSGNGNNWTVNGLAATDQVLDTPTNSFATLNPISPVSLDTFGNYAAPTQGNLRLPTPASSGRNGTWSTIGMSSGKWYWEQKYTTNSFAAGFPGGGIRYENYTQGYDYSYANSWMFDTEARIYNNNSQVIDLGPQLVNGDVIGFALDASNGKLWISQNGVWYSDGVATGDPVAGTHPAVTGLDTTKTWYAAGTCHGTNSCTTDFNFGQGGQSGLTYDSASGGTFKYTPPSGFKALSTANLPVPTIAQPNKYFDAKTYTGTGSTQSITGVNFQPDLVWLKDRTSTNNHGLFDSVRGATIYWSSNSNAAETTDVNSLTAFLSNGFSLGTASAFNTNADNYISWLWKKAPKTDGVDIQDFAWQNTAFTVSHNLGVTPAMVIVVVRGIADHRYVWHQSLSSATQSFLELDNTIGDTTNSLVWGNTAPTASVIKFAGASDNVIADTGYSGRGTLYAFAPVAGFSAFGKYTGNGSADGPFVYTGFKPRFIMLKQADGTTSWYNMDTARDTYNPALHATVLQTSGVEATNSTDYSVDFLSNGFKLRTSDSFHNASGGNYIYAAFADVPFYYSAQSAASAVSNAGTSFLMGMNF